MAENLSISNSDKVKKHHFTKTKFILKLFFFIVLLIPMLMFIGKKYSAASTENQINNWNELRFNDFYALDENSLDMLFLGSSHSYCTFDPSIIDAELNVSSFQLGMPQQHPDCTYYTLLEALNYQHPKYVVVEVYWDMVDDEFDLNQIKMLFQVMKNEELKKDFIENVFPLGEKIKYNYEILRYQNDYFAFKSTELDKKIEEKYNVAKPATAVQHGVQEYTGKGYTYCDYKMLEDEFDKTNQFKDLDGKDWNFDETQKKYLKKIIEKCKSENISLFFVTAPIANVSLDYIKNYDNIHNNVAAFAAENNIAYIDYNYTDRSRVNLTNDNFRDDAHLNHSGVEIIDKDFSVWLKNQGV